MKHPCSSIILAGGGSKRMGKNKLLLPWGDGTLFSNSIDVADSLFSEICVVGDRSVRHLTEERNVRFIEDKERTGALNGLLIGLKSISYDRAVVFAADMPFVTSDSVNFLLGHSHDYDVTIFKTDDGFHPLFGVYKNSCIPAIEKYLQSGFKKIFGFYHLVYAHFIDVGYNEYWKQVLFNINHPTDYQKAKMIRSSIKCFAADETSSKEL